MAKNSFLLAEAQRLARTIIREQTPARLQLSADAAALAAHEVFKMGPKRALEFKESYSKWLHFLADLYISDCDENHDKKIDYAKGKRDELLKSFMGEAFRPFDEVYGKAYFGEAKMIRVMREEQEKNV